MKTDEAVGYIDYNTICSKPVEIHLCACFRVVIHAHDCRSAPCEFFLASVFVGECELLLAAEPTFVVVEVLEVTGDVVEDCIIAGIVYFGKIEKAVEIAVTIIG